MGDNASSIEPDNTSMGGLPGIQIGTHRVSSTSTNVTLQSAAEEDANSIITRHIESCDDFIQVVYELTEELADPKFRGKVKGNFVIERLYSLFTAKYGAPSNEMKSAVTQTIR
jgi:hypothetical protein